MENLRMEFPSILLPQSTRKILSAAPAAVTIFGMIANGGVNVNQSKVVV
jgi:hypothetical protein